MKLNIVTKIEITDHEHCGANCQHCRYDEHRDEYRCTLFDTYLSAYPKVDFPYNRTAMCIASAKLQ
jgi:hypothetical protein